MIAVEAIEAVPFIDGIVYGEGPRWHNDRLWFTDGPAGRVCSVGETGDVAVEAEVEHASGLGWLPDGTLVVSALFEPKIHHVDAQGQVAATYDLSGLGWSTNDLLVAPDGRGYVVSWFYKWVHRKPNRPRSRRSELDAAVKAAFEASKRTYGSPRIHADLVEAGWTVSVNTVADSMRRQGLQGRKPKRRKGTTKQDKTAPKFPDLLQARLHRAGAEPEVVWRHDRDPDRRGQALSGLRPGPVLPPVAGQPDVGASRRRTGRRRDQDGCGGARRRTCIDGVIFHTDRGSTYTAKDFTNAVPPARGCRSRWAGSGRAC